MSSEIDILKLAHQIKEKRGKRGLREAAQEIGNVSASTLSRIEQGKVPDLDTFIRICRWLDVSTDYFTKSDSEADVGNDFREPEVVSLHFRADRTLDPKTIKALANMIQLAVAAVDNEQLGKQKGKHASGI